MYRDGRTHLGVEVDLLRGLVAIDRVEGMKVGVDVKINFFINLSKKLKNTII